MSRRPSPPEPAPPEAAAELGRCLEASDFGLASLFIDPRGIADPDVLKAAAAITRLRPPRARPAPADHRPVHPEHDFPDRMRARLDGINRRLLDVGCDFDAVDANMAVAISEHLDSIGLDDLNKFEGNQ